MNRTGSIVVGLIFTLAVTTVLVHKILNPSEQIEKIAFWDEPPAIRVCSSSPVKISEVADAASWWRELGYEFDLIYGTDCAEIIRYSTITIVLGQAELIQNNLLGRTTFYSNDESNEMYWAIIELAMPLERRVLEHELGHALGWMHVKEPGHMMHPKHYQGGWAFDGLIGSNENVVIY